jgi:hypothetical protein
MTIEVDASVHNSATDDIQDAIQSEDVTVGQDANNDDADDVEVSEITFDGESLNDEDDSETDSVASDDDNEDDSDIPPESENDEPLVKKLRRVAFARIKQLQKAKYEIKQLKKQSAIQTTPQPQTIQISEPVLPILAEFDYDDDKYQHAIKKYADDVVKYNESLKTVNAQKEAEIKAVADLQKAYIEQKNALNIKGFDALEQTVVNALDIPKQRMILRSEKPALVVLALAKNPQILSELVGLSDTDFAYKIAKIENKLQVNVVKKPKTKPEKLLTNTKTGTTDAKTTLEALEKEAMATGDRSKVYAFKKQQKKG